MFKKVMGYVSKDGFLGEVVSYNFVDEVAILQDGLGNTAGFAKDDVEFLNEAFELNGTTVYDKDVLGALNGKKYLVEVHNEKVCQLHMLDDELKTVKSGERFITDDENMEQLEKIMSLVGNYYELVAELPKNPDFNIEVVRSYDEKHVTFWYACNDKEQERIDLIKVVFVGHHILEEEDYMRDTYSYEDYQELLETGQLEKTSPSALLNFVTGAKYNHKEETSVDSPAVQNTQDVNVCEDCDCNGVCNKVEEEDVCKDCNQDLTECDCHLW